MPVVALFVATSAGRRARVPLCAACARRQARAVFVWRLAFASVTFAWALTLLLWVEGPRVHSPVAGALFVPLVLAWAALERRSTLGPARARSMGDALLLSGDPRLAHALLERVGTSTPARPPLWELAGWALPALVAVVLARTEPPAPLEVPCTWGTYPLAFRQGSARVVGCHLGNGMRHGRVEGGPGAWNTGSALAFAGAWRFDEPHGPVTFLDRESRVRVTGTFRRGAEVGVWRTVDEGGALIDVLDMDRRAIVEAPRLACPEGTTPHLEGSAWWGSRVCRTADGTTRDGVGYSVREGLTGPP
jgi:hypothetical protein